MSGPFVFSYLFFFLPSSSSSLYLFSCVFLPRFLLSRRMHPSGHFRCVCLFGTDGVGSLNRQWEDAVRANIRKEGNHNAQELALFYLLQLISLPLFFFDCASGLMENMVLILLILFSIIIIIIIAATHLMQGGAFVCKGAEGGREEKGFRLLCFELCTFSQIGEAEKRGGEVGANQCQPDSAASRSAELNKPCINRNHSYTTS